MSADLFIIFLQKLLFILLVLICVASLEEDPVLGLKYVEQRFPNFLRFADHLSRSRGPLVVRGADFGNHFCREIKVEIKNQRDRFTGGNCCSILTLCNL